MDAYDAVRTLLAVREYKDKPVPQDLVRRIVEAGRLTASSINLQPWHFIVVQDRDTLRQLGELIKTGSYIPQAAMAIVVAIEDTQYAVSDASRAIQSMMLTAWAEGVGSNWTGFRHIDLANPLLDIPQNLEVLAVVPFGYPARHVGGSKKNRKPLGEVASREKYGQPFE